MKLTAIVLVGQNDGVKAKKAISSVSFADEVMVVKEKFLIKDFSIVRNSVLPKAKGEWVLFVDSDEVVGNKLREEVIKKIKMNEDWEKRGKRRYIDGYFLKRRDRFLGKWLRFGETAGVRLSRLAKKDAGRWERPVHEVWKINGRAGGLKNPLLHYSHDSVEEMVEKLDRYSEIEGKRRIGEEIKKIKNSKDWEKMRKRNTEELAILIQMIIFPVGKFVWNYLFRLGFLDGMEGFIHAGMMSGHSFLVRAKALNALMR